jgi:muconolactone delta-isomerase
MNEFIVTVHLPSELSQEFVSLIPSHRARVNELMQQGVFSSYSLSADRSMQWITVVAAAEDEVVKTLMTLPLYRFMEYEIHELMFHNIPVFAVPRFSVN